MKKILIGSIVLIVAVVFTVVNSQKETPSHNYVDVTLGTTVIKSEVVDTEASRELGLSGRESLATSTGLFFVFDRSGFWGIWMKDMKFPIDVLWFDEHGTIVGSTEHMEPKSYPKVYIPDSPARFVLEVPVDTVKNAHIQIGDIAIIKQ